MSRLRRVEALNNILTWEPLVSLGAIVCGWLWGFWLLVSGQKKHRETLALLKQILESVDGPPEERRRIIHEVREHIGVKASAGVPTVSVGLTDPRKRDGEDQS